MGKCFILLTQIILFTLILYFNIITIHKLNLSDRLIVCALIGNWLLIGLTLFNQVTDVTSYRVNNLNTSTILQTMVVYSGNKLHVENSSKLINIFIHKVYVLSYIDYQMLIALTGIYKIMIYSKFVEHFTKKKYLRLSMAHLYLIYDFYMSTFMQDNDNIISIGYP